MGGVNSTRSVKPQADVGCSSPGSVADLTIPMEANPTETLNALLATGMSVEDALDAIAETYPVLAQEAFLAWGNGRDFGEKSLRLPGRTWVTALPEGMDLEACDLKGCVNLKVLPRALRVWLYLDIRECPKWNRILPAGLETPNAEVLTDLGYFAGPFTPNGSIVTRNGSYSLP